MWFCQSASIQLSRSMFQIHKQKEVPMKRPAKWKGHVWLSIVLLTIPYAHAQQSGFDLTGMGYREHALLVVTEATKGEQALWNLAKRYAEAYRRHPNNPKLMFGYAVAATIYLHFAGTEVFSREAQRYLREGGYGGRLGEPNTVVPAVGEVYTLVQNMIRLDSQSVWPYVAMLLSREAGLPNKEYRILESKTTRHTLPGGIVITGIHVLRDNAEEIKKRYLRKAVQCDPNNPYVLMWRALDERNPQKALELVKTSWQQGGKDLFPLKCLATEAQIYDRIGDTENLRQVIERINHITRETSSSPFVQAFLKGRIGWEWVGRKPGKQPWAITPQPTVK
jgi:hypothetical protein